MARRKRGETVSSALGAGTVTAAVKWIDERFRRMCALHLPAFEHRAMICEMFDPDVISRVMAARDDLSYSHHGCEYGLTSLPAKLFVKFPGDIPSIAASRFCPQPGFEAVLDAARAAHELYARVELVKHVLRHVDSSWSLAAIRVYWPAGLSICTERADLAALMSGDPPTNYKVPPTLGRSLPALRETANTITELRFVPDAPAVNGNLTLMFYRQSIERAGLTFFGDQTQIALG